MQGCLQLGHVDVRVVERAVATVCEQIVQFRHACRVRGVRVLEQCGDLEQVGPDRRDAVVQQRFAAAGDWIRLVCGVGRASQPLHKYAALAVGSALAPAPQDPSAALDGRAGRRAGAQLRSR